MAPNRTTAPTIIDVAREAGVSRATASRALSRYGRIAPATVESVESAARRIGYRPNTIAQSMRAGKTQTIGLVMLADMTNAFFARATKAIVTSAKEAGYQVLVANTDEDPAVEEQAVETLLQMRVDGLIVVPSTSDEHGHLTPEHIGDTPVVLVDRRLDDLSLSSVTTDDRLGAAQAVHHAVERGHHRLGFVIAVGNLQGVSTKAVDGGVSTVRDRREGFVRGARECRIPARDQVWRFCGGTADDIEAAVASVLDQPNAPSIIFASNNDVALGVLRVAKARGIEIGTALSLVTIDDSPWAAAMVPGLTVVARPVDELGARAVQQLLDQIAHPRSTRDHIVLPTALISRDSVATLTPPRRRLGKDA